MSTNKPRLQADADISRNRLLITIAGAVDKAELDRLYTDVRFCVADLKPGFDVITDLTQATLGHLSALPTFRKIMAYLASNGVRDVVRVMNPDNLIHRQILNHAARVPGYKAMYVTSREEAEGLLSQSSERTCLRFSIPDQTVTLLFDGEKKSGRLVDISAGGCAIDLPEPPPAGSEVTITFTLAARDFSLRSRILRSNANECAAAFASLDDEEREALTTSLIAATRQ